MKPKELWYEKKFNLGNYETENIGILVELEGEEKASDIMPKLKKFVEGMADKRATNAVMNRSTEANK